MKTIIIDVPDYNDSFSRIVLSGTAYYLRFTYNDTYDYWTFGVYSANKLPILQGVKLVPKFVLNLFCAADDMPMGVFGVLTNEDHLGRNTFLEGKATFSFTPLS